MSANLEAYAAKKRQQMEDAKRIREERKNGIARPHRSLRQEEHEEEREETGGNEEVYQSEFDNRKLPSSYVQEDQFISNSRSTPKNFQSQPLKPIVRANSNTELKEVRKGPLVKKLPWEIDSVRKTFESNSTFDSNRSRDNSAGSSYSSSSRNVSARSQTVPISREREEEYEDDFDIDNSPRTNQKLSLLKSKRKPQSSARSAVPSSSHQESSYSLHREVPMSSSRKTLTQPNNIQDEDDEVVQDEEEVIKPLPQRKPLQSASRQPPQQPMKRQQTPPEVQERNLRTPRGQMSELPDGNSAGAFPTGNLVACSICERNFASDRIEKHTTVCAKRTENDKRKKVFDGTKARLGDIENAGQYIRKFKAEKAKEEKAEAVGVEKPLKKIPKWKMQRQAFIQAIGKQSSSKVGNDDLDVDMASMDTRKECSNCGRRFNEESHDRHVKICKNIFTNKKGPSRNPSASRAPAPQISSPTPRESNFNNSKPTAQRGGFNSTMGAPQQSHQNNSYASLSSTMSPKSEGSPKKMSAVKSRIAVQQELTPCPHCGRKFEKHAAERHFPVCGEVLNKPKGGTLRGPMQTRGRW